LRFVDSDMHIMEPPDLFDRYLDPAFRHRISVPVGVDGRPKRGVAGLTIIDGLPTSDMDLQQYRKRVRPAGSQTTQPLSGSRLIGGVRELGAVGSFIRPNLVNDHYWHSNYWDPLYSVHEELNVTWGFHEGVSAVYSRMIPLYGENRFYRHVASHWIEMQQAMVAMIIGGVFEFHPRLRVGFLEAQNSWAPGRLSRIEWDSPQYRDSHAPYLTLTPREYFRRNCWAAVEGSEP